MAHLAMTDGDTYPRYFHHRVHARAYARGTWAVAKWAGEHGSTGVS